MKKLHDTELKEQKTAYVVGFGLSVILTCIAFILVGLDIISGIVGIAIEYTGTFATRCSEYFLLASRKREKARWKHENCLR